MLNKVVIWLLAFFGSISVGGGAGWLANLNNKMAAIEVAQNTDRKDASSSREQVIKDVGEARERMIRVETKLESLQDTVKESRDEQKQINNKLDILLQERRK